MLKSIFKAVAVSAVAAVFSIGCGGDGGNSTGGGGGGGGGGLTITGLPDGELWAVYVFPAGTDISNYVSFVMSSAKVEALGSNGGGSTGNLFPLARWTTDGPDGTLWKGSGNRPVVIIDGMAADLAYWATVNFSNGNATVPFSSFTPVPLDIDGTGGGGGGGGETKSSYTITFDANGGTVSPTSGKTGDDGKLASLPTPTRSGYTFDGWFTAATGGTAVTVSNVYSGNVTIYARWTAEKPAAPTSPCLPIFGCESDAGWPPGGILSEFGIGGLTAPSGTTDISWSKWSVTQWVGTDTTTTTTLWIGALTTASHSYFDDGFESNGWTVVQSGTTDAVAARVWEKSLQSQRVTAQLIKQDNKLQLIIQFSFKK